MITLGIDTSCDDTSVAVVGEGQILANLVSSHLIHSEYGGVVPELASRAHTCLLYPMTELALKTAGISFDEVDLVAATAGPGLMGSLLCGLSFAKGLACASGKPFIAVNHLEGHIYSIFLSHPHLVPPVLVLLVSGGHTELVLVRAEFEYLEIGATLDDACGEALDKVGKLMGLGYPAGAAVERLAKEASNPVPLPRPNPRELEFSYSGLKTAARNYLAVHPDTSPADLARGLEEAAFDHLTDRVVRAVKKSGVYQVGLCGGVARNKRLRSKLSAAGDEAGFKLYFPLPELCTDNAAMIAVAGRARYETFGESLLDTTAFDRVAFAQRSSS
ncbi:MAG: tRNA (adenosine(37)-N6)-threonylcarbamoyltransferase complex transferase subunit TsaD [candidate division WOR-3 bacterium]|nr:tRNA (adenosine(37)-N6)-threonylcarbamoyltransferase complex transferase subunit TsaD [candidate division WOR-3 bacterium]